MKLGVLSQTTFLFLVGSRQLVHADQAVYDDAADAYNYNNNNNNNNLDDNFYNQFTVCENSLVEVTDLMIHCDSPGAYYYGSSKYRNSNTCQGGDKAKMNLVFQIQDDSLVEAGTLPVLTIDVEGYGTIASYSSTVEFCESENIQAPNGVDCPGAGEYEYFEIFYWNYQDAENESNEYEYNWRPTVSIGVASTWDSNYYDLGGANTQLCAGSSVVNWSSGVRKSVSNTLHTFVLTLGFIMGAVMCIFTGLWYAQYYTRFQLRRRRADDVLNEDLLNDEDMKRISMMSKDRDLIDA